MSIIVPHKCTDLSPTGYHVYVEFDMLKYNCLHCDAYIARENVNTYNALVAEILDEESNTSKITKHLPKPPLGLRPRFIHEEGRMREIAEAIARYASVRKALPGEWIHEYNELAELLESRKTT